MSASVGGPLRFPSASSAAASAGWCCSLPLIARQRDPSPVRVGVHRAGRPTLQCVLLLALLAGFCWLPPGSGSNAVFATCSWGPHVNLSAEAVWAPDSGRLGWAEATLEVGTRTTGVMATPRRTYWFGWHRTPRLQLEVEGVMPAPSTPRHR
jgi:hypothetical protein